MAKDKKEKSKLMGAFKWAAKATVSVAFGFAVLGAFDFTLFHNMPEGEFFMESIRDPATDLLRADFPILGVSVADMFYSAGNFFGGPSGVDVVAEASFEAEKMASQAVAPSNAGKW